MKSDKTVANLRVAYANMPPFVIVRNSSGEIHLEGFIPEIFRAVAKWMDFNFTLIREPEDRYGIWENGTWNGMIGMIYRNDVDIILNPILPKDTILEFTRLSNPITIEAYTILSGKIHEEAGLFLYFSVLDTWIWICLMVTLLIVAASCTILVTQRMDIPLYSIFIQFCNYNWILFLHMLRQTVAQKYLLQWRRMKFSVLLTTLIMLWTFGIGMLTMNTFQSLLVTKLTLRKSKPLVDGIEDMAKREDIQPIVPREIQIDHVLQNSGIPAYEKAWKRINNKFVPLEQVFAFQNLLIVQKGKTCIIHGHLIIKDRLSTFFKKTGSCNLHLSSNYFYPFSLPFAMKRSLPQLFVHKFNLGITRLVDADISGKWFKAALQEATLCTSYTAKTVKPLGLENLHGVLLVWGIGLVLAFTSLLIEILFIKVS